ncbi:NAD-dependent epimerase/dehydratase family protein [Arthrobacter sulfonylureivorans]|uniref:NAD-dependent epimerase/dehydratase family protein n=1 Tax=Arthrobacter sulfonylureivorans TaxID=2486855 RepID=A0ABY3WCU1_9MICC|nr:NAD-dependent epimerase/dehydratase family protein [Arthrobacter sulfonylureivorans]UNK45529.1 NAD-dependent epimerase/dehydratase family protein [Arthrobacter sulfonylureivorans]
MRIAVVGASGNVGTALLRRLHAAQSERADDLEIVGIARRVPDAARAPYDGVTWVALDVASGDARQRLAEAFKGCDAVVHLAWVLQPNHDEETMRRVNVDGTANVLAAAVNAGVGHVVCASSVGAYSPGPKDSRVSEDWPARGIASSHYSRFKGQQEELLDRFADDHPEIKVARLRPGLIFQAQAGSQIGRYFVGPWIPKFFVNRLRLPLFPFPEEFVFQALHADDMADAYWRVLDQGARGAFNVAAEPVLTPGLVAALFGARRWLPVPVPLVRLLVGAAWSARLLASDPGWVDMARAAPVMDTTRARTELGWNPRVDSVSAIREVLHGMAAAGGVPESPAMRPRSRCTRAEPRTGA